MVKVPRSATMVCQGGAKWGTGRRSEMRAQMRREVGVQRRHKDRGAKKGAHRSCEFGTSRRGTEKAQRWVCRVSAYMRIRIYDKVPETKDQESGSQYLG